MKKKPIEKRICFLALSLMVLLAFPSCLKDGDGSSILLNDPQEIPLITDFLPEDLLTMFGEENVHFGDQSPIVDMEFVSNHEYAATSLEPPFAPPVGTVSPIKHYHKIVQQYLQIADYYSMSSEETNCHLLSPVYLTGSGISSLRIISRSLTPTVCLSTQPYFPAS